MGAALADLDGDGDLDLIVNTVGQRTHIFLNDGKGHFTGIPASLNPDRCGSTPALADSQESGIKVYGEQRGCALGDFDRDSRVDLVVTQNGAATELYRNTRARPGLRVRLLGPEGNRSAIGASLRLKLADHYGPLREIHGGSGYLSQDSVVPVLGTPEPLTALEIRWPGGKHLSVPVPPEAREITVDQSGRVEKTR